MSRPLVREAVAPCPARVAFSSRAHGDGIHFAGDALRRASRGIAGTSGTRICGWASSAQCRCIDTSGADAEDVVRTSGSLPRVAALLMVSSAAWRRLHSQIAELCPS